MDEVESTAMVKADREAEMAIKKVDYTLTKKQEKGKEFKECEIH
jgi:pseudaminic acid synthase